jgi:hypothetical protein
MSKNMTSTTGHDTYFNGKIISLPEVGNRDNALTFYETSRLITLGRRTEQMGLMICTTQFNFNSSKWNASTEDQYLFIGCCYVI